MTKTYPIDFCLLGENAPEYLCITGSKYKKCGEGYVNNLVKESLSTTLSNKFNLSIPIINAVLSAYPDLDPVQAIKKYGPSPDLRPITHWGIARHRAIKLMKPTWQLGEHKRYSQEEFDRCRALVAQEDKIKKQQRENFNKKTQLQYKRAKLNPIDTKADV